MARGKHAGKDNTFFGDENYYRRNRNNNDMTENNDDLLNKYEEKAKRYTDENTSNISYDNDDYNTSFSNSYLNKYSNNYSNNNSEDDYDNEEQDDDEYDDYDDEEGFNFKKLILIVLIVVVILLILSTVLKNGKKGKNNTGSNISDSSTMISQYEGYKVLGQLKIDKLGITQYILDSTEDKALENGIGKLYGGSLNNYGNFCVVGHNYDNIFAKLPELKIGDTFTILDKKMQETKYKVTSTSSVEPDNLECLVQTDNKIEVTLITCQEGTTKRLVVKAEKYN